MSRPFAAEGADGGVATALMAKAAPVFKDGTPEVGLELARGSLLARAWGRNGGGGAGPHPWMLVAPGLRPLPLLDAKWRRFRRVAPTNPFPSTILLGSSWGVPRGGDEPPLRLCGNGSTSNTYDFGELRGFVEALRENRADLVIERLTIRPRVNEILYLVITLGFLILLIRGWTAWRQGAPRRLSRAIGYASSCC